MTAKTPSATKASPRPTPQKGATTPPRAATLPQRANATADRPSVVLAAVTGAHGIGGEVKLKLFADDLAAFTTFNGGTLTLKRLRGTIAQFAEVADRTAAEALRGTQLTVPRASLPALEDGEYYHADLLGLPVVSSDGVALGEIIAVENFGAGDVVEIRRPSGKTFMVPMTPAAVPEWDEMRLVVDAAYAVD